MRSRTKIMDATLGLIADVGFEGVTIAGAAQAAGVSRQTVYSIFGSREELVSQAISGQLLEAYAEMTARLERIEDPGEYVVETIVLGRTLVREHPVLAVLLRGDGDNPVFDPGMVDRAKPIGRQLLAPMVRRYPELEPHADDIVVMSLLLGLSVLMFAGDSMESDDELRAFLRRWLQPAMPPVGKPTRDS
ncbi:TetR/AcrR family transcriptional regulator [Rhodococcus sp. CX]|uniref:TetR/AcrR family transcriptional regulator n=1 Tax=Rhodococcus sp. CX TaxID=2789880 RepID=UPI0018CE1958|nr:TetR/AcrR family transcriptional regulator [Rhodococcus sp. CX]MBH0118943.1 TetR/AcrR family transcriptional regulator [Rhodococcus sp. CX]